MLSASLGRRYAALGVPRCAALRGRSVARSSRRPPSLGADAADALLHRLRVCNPAAGTLVGQAEERRGTHAGELLARYFDEPAGLISRGKEEGGVETAQREVEGGPKDPPCRCGLAIGGDRLAHPALEGSDPGFSGRRTAFIQRPRTAPCPTGQLAPPRGPLPTGRRGVGRRAPQRYPHRVDGHDRSCVSEGLAAVEALVAGREEQGFAVKVLRAAMDSSGSRWPRETVAKTMLEMTHPTRRPPYLQLERAGPNVYRVVPSREGLGRP